MKLDIQKMAVSTLIEGAFITGGLVFATPMIVPLLGGIATPISAALTIGYYATISIVVGMKNVLYAYVIPKKYQ